MVLIAKNDWYSSKISQCLRSFTLNKNMMSKHTILWIMLVVSQLTFAQDLHYADIQTMNLWQNQSLKMDRKTDLRLNFRDIKYQSLLAFRTASGLLNVPLLKGSAADNYNGKSFLNATIAGALDKSNKGIFKNSTGLIGLSYAQRLTADLVYLSAGFQGSITQTRLGTFGVLFPDQFDQYGPIPSETRDPLKSGRSYNWASFNAGLSVYQNTEYKDWYIGASLRHINRPFTDEQKQQEYRLAPTAGMQAGLTVKSESNQIGVYGMANWKAKAYEYLIGAKFVKMISGGEKNEERSLGLGLALRLNDAVIPNLQLKLKKSTLGFHYDMNISGLKAAGYSRQGFEVALKQQLN